eukprot:11407696-Alexandrium_andersonii.AAC.1
MQANAAPSRVAWRDPLQSLRHVDHIAGSVAMALGRPDVEALSCQAIRNLAFGKVFHFHQDAEILFRDEAVF